jgi:hypothetical protein
MESDRGQIEIANELGVAAVAPWTLVAGRLEVKVGTARTFGMSRADAARLLASIGTVAQTPGCERVQLRVADPVVRTVAREQQFTGGLRADLERVSAPWELQPDVASAALDRDAIGVGLNRLLPDGAVTIESGGPIARLARRSETGMPGCARVVATRAGRTVRVVAPLGPDVMVESLAAALDTLLAIFDRFTEVARQIPPIVFGMAAMEMMDGHVSGQAGGGRITINPAHVSTDAVATLIAKYADAETLAGTAGAPSRYRAPGRPSGYSLPVDRVMAHEVGHCVDGLSLNGRIADSAPFRARIGRALGVESVELALRGRRPDAPPEWRRAYGDLVAQISDYATTSGVELFAEIFAAWWNGDAGPVVEAFDEIMQAQFPQ